MLVGFGQLLSIDEQLLLHLAAWISVGVTLLQFLVVLEVEDKVEKLAALHNRLVRFVGLAGEGEELFGRFVDSMETLDEELALSFVVLLIVLLAELAKFIDVLGHLVLDKLEHIIEISEHNRLLSDNTHVVF